MYVGRRARFPLLLASVLLAGCGKQPVEVAAAGSISLVQGAAQSVQAGSELPNQIIVRVLDTDGKPLGDHPVGFTIAAGGGAVQPGSALTDENGEAKTKWTLGTSDVNQRLLATVQGLEPLAIAATGLFPADLVVAQGNNQSAKAGGALPNAIVVRVIGPNNTPMKNIAVAFQVLSGGGLITPPSAMTNTLGEVTLRWTLGPQVGAQALSINSTSLPSITVLATATP
ncbi:MAG: Ig-like domain-containing protein [Gemmatimonadota bacterium]